MYFVNPTREQFKALFNLPVDQPVGMLNLLRFKDAVGRSDAQAVGREEYERYSAQAGASFEKVGGKILWTGKPLQVFIGGDDERWDLAFLALYPNPQAFVDLIKSQSYRAAAVHRTAAVEDSRLIVCAQLAPGKGFAPQSYEPVRTGH